MADSGSGAASLVGGSSEPAPSAGGGTAQVHGPAGMLKEVERHVGARISALQKALLDHAHPHHSQSVTSLARLRRSDPGDAGDPSVWDVTFLDTPSHLVGRGDDPSRAERAIHAALVLFAGHVQSANGARHVRGRRLGHAIGDLARELSPPDEPNGYADGAVAHRFRSFAMATSWTHAVAHLRGLVSLLRSRDIALDYGALAADLYRMQTPQGLRRARLQWARDFHQLPSNPTSQTPTTVVPSKET